eukprot:GGOE01018640.1.p1 GENE.GGOE01018640.1~~GGOE01018640.1.p1  ORF type:complete len:307 (+),score=12.53 GGOE01018640.1:2-922(+)
MHWDYELPLFSYHENGAVLFKHQSFHRVRMERLLDVKKMQDAFLKRGTVLYAHGTTGPTRDMRFKRPPIARPLPNWIQRCKEVAKKASVHKGKPLKITHFPSGPGDVAIGRSGWPAFKELIQHLYFAPHIEAISQHIIDALNASYNQYNGVHLRIEPDFVRHPYLLKDRFHVRTCLQGSIHCLEHAYLPVLRKENSSLPYYVACGMLSVPMNNTWQVWAHLKQFAPTWNYSKEFITLEQAQGLVYEELAAVDLLVLAHSNVFFGMTRSTFTCFVSVYRASRGVPGRDLFVDPLVPECGPNFLPHLQ